MSKINLREALLKFEKVFSSGEDGVVYKCSCSREICRVPNIGMNAGDVLYRVNYAWADEVSELMKRDLSDYSIEKERKVCEILVSKMNTEEIHLVVSLICDLKARAGL